MKEGVQKGGRGGKKDVTVGRRDREGVDKGSEVGKGWGEDRRKCRMRSM